MNRTKQYMSKFNKNAAPFTAADYERAKLGITDYLAANFLAKDQQEMTKLIQALGYGEGDSLIIGREATASASFAALYNGLQTHLLDMDDVHSEVRGHPSAVILSALFALAEPTTSGRLFLESYIYGIELMAQLGKLVNPTHYEQGWHNTSTLGGMAAAGALAKLLQLSLDEQCQAMSIAATQAAGLRMSFGTPIKPMHAGFAARNAVDSILLVKAGFPAQTDFLFHPQGFIATLYISLFRGMPTLVQLFIIYYGLPQIFPEMSNLQASQAAIIGFSLKESSYLAEIFRAALGSVDKGQMEAGLAVGMKKVKIYTRIILPQAAVNALPATGNTFISLIKESSLAFTLGITELFAEGKMLAAASLRFFETYLVVGLVYWGLIIIYSFFQRLVEKALSKPYVR